MILEAESIPVPHLKVLHADVKVSFVGMLPHLARHFHGRFGLYNRNMST